MLSVAVDGSGSPSGRALARGLSEDESLRIIIRETETPSRRLTRSDSRGGTLKRKGGQCDQDLFKALPDVMELQTSYEEVVQELHGLEVEREALLFQVDVLQDALQSVEELLAEAQREAGQASREVELERVANRRLEDTVRALMSEVERLREERSTLSTLQAQSLLLEEATATSTLAPAPSTLAPAPSSAHACGVSAGMGLSLAEAGQGSWEETRASPLQKMVDITLAKVPTLALDEPCSTDGVLGRPCGLEEEDERINDTDSVSAYEDASADTPELDHMFPGVHGVDGGDGGEGEEEEERGGTDPDSLSPNSSCVVS